MSNIQYLRRYNPGGQARNRATRASELIVGIAAVALLASAHTFASASENPARLALEHYACAVVMGLHQPGDLYETCIRSLDKSLSELDRARAASAERSACARRGFMSGTRDFALCAIAAEQSPVPGSQKAMAPIP
jgi:hypothetical protein